MRILILGGTAFLSAEIARQAAAAGHAVTCLARGSAATPPEGAAWLRADRTMGPPAYAEAAGDWDAVIDVARDPEQARDALEALAPTAAHWTVVSSCSVYADHSVPGADESAALLPRSRGAPASRRRTTARRSRPSSTMPSPSPAGGPTSAGPGWSAVLATVRTDTATGRPGLPVTQDRSSFRTQAPVRRRSSTSATSPRGS